MLHCEDNAYVETSFGARALFLFRLPKRPAVPSDVRSNPNALGQLEKAGRRLIRTGSDRQSLSSITALVFLLLTYKIVCLELVSNELKNTRSIDQTHKLRNRSAIYSVWSNSPNVRRTGANLRDHITYSTDFLRIDIVF